MSETTATKVETTGGAAGGGDNNSNNNNTPAAAAAAAPAPGIQAKNDESARMAAKLAEEVAIHKKELLAMGERLKKEQESAAAAIAEKQKQYEAQQKQLEYFKNDKKRACEETWESGGKQFAESVSRELKTMKVDDENVPEIVRSLMMTTDPLEAGPGLVLTAASRVVQRSEANMSNMAKKEAEAQAALAALREDYNKVTGELSYHREERDKYIALGAQFNPLLNSQNRVRDAPAPAPAPAPVAAAPAPTTTTTTTNDLQAAQLVMAGASSALGGTTAAGGGGGSAAGISDRDTWLNAIRRVSADLVGDYKM